MYVLCVDSINLKFAPSMGSTVKHLRAGPLSILWGIYRQYSAYQLTFPTLSTLGLSGTPVVGAERGEESEEEWPSGEASGSNW